jgi:nucleoside-diphosphate-sugar epimerase
MRVLVTGGRGFLGRHIVDALRENGHAVVSLGSLDGDLARPGVAHRLIADHAPHVVVHLAAVMPGDERIAENAPITSLVAAACAERGIPLFHGSSTAVHADAGAYAESKRASEVAAGDATMLRFHFPYGPGQRRGAVPTMLRQALAGEPIVAYRDWERSFCFAADAAAAVRELVERDVRGAYDIGRDDEPRSLVDVARLVCEITGRDAGSIEVVDGDVQAHATLDFEPLRRLGWRPLVGFEDGLRRTRDWVESGAA